MGLALYLPRVRSNDLLDRKMRCRSISVIFTENLHRAIHLIARPAAAQNSPNCDNEDGEAESSRKEYFEPRNPFQQLNGANSRLGWMEGPKPQITEQSAKCQSRHHGGGQSAGEWQDRAHAA